MRAIEESSESRDEAQAEFIDQHAAPATPRLRLAREIDGSVVFTMRDTEGRPRLVLEVARDGEASVRVSWTRTDQL
jgi:hypothetical protein